MKTQRESRDDDKASGQARWEEIRRVVQSRGELAEIEIPFGAVADHGVQGADRFVSHGQGDAAQEKIKERRNDAVAGAFG